jgi:putative transposase
MISFSGAQFPKEIILFAVYFYVRYGISYRDLEEIMEERGVNLDHATLNRWVIKYSPLIASVAKKPSPPRGGWMKRISKLKANGSICIEPLINLVTLLILWVVGAICC